LARENFSREAQVMSMYIDNAKTYVQLSGAALALSITFVRDVVGTAKEASVSLKGWSGGLLIASWAGFLAAICAGALYQFLAVRYIETKSDLPDSEPEKTAGPLGRWLSARIESPGDIYDVMILLFYAAAILFTVSAIVRVAAGH
jgi:hypothetical protein